MHLTRTDLVAFLRRGAATLAFTGLALATLAIPGTAGGQQSMPELPQEVKEWLERDQARRWMNLIEVGEGLYAEGSCSRCHGADGASGRNGPDLTDDVWVQSDGSLEGIWETIFWGVRRRDFHDPDRRFQMNPKGGMDLEWEQMEALTAYVWSLSNGNGLSE